MSVHRLIKILTLGICLTSTIVGVILMFKLKPEYYRPTLHFIKYLMTGTSTITNHTKIDCKIPRLEIWPEFIKIGWEVGKINPDCSKSETIAELNDTDQMLRVVSKHRNSSCCFSQVFGIHKNDNDFRISNCTKIVDNSVSVTNMEMVLVKCGYYVNYEANIPIKPNVQSKMDAWKRRKTSQKDLPLNILMIGIESVSRSHAYRSIPKTMDLMKRMGFHDFQGYHSVAPSTLTNYMGFLMGLKQKTVREGCAPNWKSPFDSCPFIWNDFSRNDYVTMYIEDDMGSFNWGGQSGFHSQPTDYYVHPLFIASKFTPCTSSESVPQFLLRYTRRFVKKFKDTPFFSFTFMANPFHEELNALQSLENDTLEFFESLQSITGLLERTVVIFLSDHGWRMNYPDSKSGIEAYIERGLPPLFIRFPELLNQRHPELELDSILEHNVNSLLTPFDLHHTFAHILTLDGGNTTEFEPIRPDRQSLFTRMDSENRNCESVNIPEGSCVCNVNVDSLDDQLIHNQYLRSMLSNTLKIELNQIVISSKYKDVCEEWEVFPSRITSVHIIQKTTNHIDFQMQFHGDSAESCISDDGVAKFETKIRVKYKNGTNDFNECKLIGKISRVNWYGNQSSCVGFETDADKEMKGFCKCRSPDSYYYD